MLPRHCSGAIDAVESCAYQVDPIENGSDDRDQGSSHAGAQNSIGQSRPANPVLVLSAEEIDRLANRHNKAAPGLDHPLLVHGRNCPLFGRVRSPW